MSTLDTGTASPCSASENGDRIMSGGRDQFEVWHSRTGVALPSMSNFNGMATHGLISPDGCLALASTYLNAISQTRLWDATSGALHQEQFGGGHVAWH